MVSPADRPTMTFRTALWSSSDSGSGNGFGNGGCGLGGRGCGFGRGSKMSASAGWENTCKAVTPARSAKIRRNLGPQTTDNMVVLLLLSGSRTDTAARSLMSRRTVIRPRSSQRLIRRIRYSSKSSQPRGLYPKMRIIFVPFRKSKPMPFSISSIQPEWSMTSVRAGKRCTRTSWI